MSAIISRLHEIRESYVQHRILARELATCTADDLNDLETAFARHADVDAEAEDIRRILTAQRALATPQA